MARIACFYGLGPDHKLDRKLTKAGQPHRARVIRLFCRVSFRTPSGWSRPFPAVIDTGAYISIVPHYIWSTADVTVYADHYVRGLVPKPACKLDVKVGEVAGKGDKVPLILGFAELLEELKLFSDPTTNTAWLEEP